MTNEFTKLAEMDQTLNSKSKNRGLTVIELLLSVAVFGLLAGLLWNGLASYRDRQAVSSGVEMVLAALSEARMKTVASERNMQYGVRLKSDRVVVFPGTEFTEPNSLNLEYPLERLIHISTTSLESSTSTVIFSKITGVVDNSGTITISLKSDPSASSTIKVSRTGEASEQ